MKSSEKIVFDSSEFPLLRTIFDFRFSKLDGSGKIGKT